MERDSFEKIMQELKGMRSEKSMDDDQNDTKSTMYQKENAEDQTFVEQDEDIESEVEGYTPADVLNAVLEGAEDCADMGEEYFGIPGKIVGGVLGGAAGVLGCAGGAIEAMIDAITD